MFWKKKDKEKKEKKEKKKGSGFLGFGKKSSKKKGKTQASKKKEKVPKKKVPQDVSKKRNFDVPKPIEKIVTASSMNPNKEENEKINKEIIIRLRGKDGTFKIKAKLGERIIDLKKKLSPFNKIEPNNFSIAFDPKFKRSQILSGNGRTDNYTIGKFGDKKIYHGVMLYYKYNKELISKQERAAEKEREKRELVGDGNDLRNLGLKYIKKQWTMYDFVTHVGEKKIVIKSQKNAVCKEFSIDQYSANNFVMFLRSLAFQIDRCGYIIGEHKEIKEDRMETDEEESEGEYETDSEEEDEESDTEDEETKEKEKEKEKKHSYIDYSEFNYQKVIGDAIYEPIQAFKDGEIETKNDPFIKNVVDKISKLLKKERIGYIFSYKAEKQREFALTAKDILKAAKHQDEFGDHFITIVVFINSKTMKTNFEAFQVSKQCVELYKKGFLLLDPKDNSKFKLKYPVEYKKKIVDEVDCLMFIVNVPIKNFVSDYQVGFPLKNRDNILPEHRQSIYEVKKWIGRTGKRRNQPFYQSIQDFSLLFYLTEYFSISSDFPKICEGILAKSDRNLGGFKEILQAYMEHN